MTIPRDRKDSQLDDQKKAGQSHFKTVLKVWLKQVEGVFWSGIVKRWLRIKERHNLLRYYRKCIADAISRAISKLTSFWRVASQAFSGNNHPAHFVML
jgi:hypothetical protein